MNKTKNIYRLQMNEKEIGSFLMFLQKITDLWNKTKSYFLYNSNDLRKLLSTFDSKYNSYLRHIKSIVLDNIIRKLIEFYSTEAARIFHPRCFGSFSTINTFFPNSLFNIGCVKWRMI